MNHPVLDRQALLVKSISTFEQAVCNLTAWVKKTTAAPAATNYTTTSGNAIRLLPTAAEQAGTRACRASE